MTDERHPDETQIRERAYTLWEADGRPEGKSHDHWRQALLDIASDDVEPEAQDAEPVPVTKPKKPGPKARARDVTVESSVSPAPEKPLNPSKGGLESS
jgi:hypothetical protein